MGQCCSRMKAHAAAPPHRMKAQLAAPPAPHRMEAQLAAAPPHLSDDIWAEILVCLPVKSVLRFRAVSKAWRDITSSPLFLAANARRQPAKVVLYTYLGSEQRKNRSTGRAFDIALDVLPVSGETADQRRLIRYSRSEPLASTDLFLLDSCNGVFLFRNAAAGIYSLCNPVTRQWAELPKFTDDQSFGGRTIDVREYAFYFHQQSGEYRLLCARLTSDGRRTWCILSTGAAEPRQVDTHTADDGKYKPVPHTPSEMPVALHESMHWPPRRLRSGRDFSSEQGKTTTEMVAFDVQSEKFRLMAGPRIATHPMMKLFVMHGMLVAANFDPAAKHVDLWFLVDYGAGRWERRHQVPTPWQYNLDVEWSLWSTAALCDDQGNIMLGRGSLRGLGQGGLLVYNVRTKTVRAVHVSFVATPRTKDIRVSRHVFRESLVEHPNFKRSSTADLTFIHFWC